MLIFDQFIALDYMKVKYGVFIFYLIEFSVPFEWKEKIFVNENFRLLICYLTRQFVINQSHAKFAKYYVSNYQYNKYNKYNYLKLVWLTKRGNCLSLKIIFNEHDTFRKQKI